MLSALLMLVVVGFLGQDRLGVLGTTDLHATYPHQNDRIVGNGDYGGMVDDNPRGNERIVNGNWSPWQTWSGCTKTCGGGIHYRERVCDSPPPSGDGWPCTGKSHESRGCNTWACPRPGIVRIVRNMPEWVNGVLRYDVMVASRDGPASLLWQREVYNIPPECNGPDGYRSGCDWPREYNKSSCERRNYCIWCPGGDGDNGPQCNLREAVNGGWSPWQPWYGCTVRCGGGVRLRERECDNPTPFGEYASPCIGKAQQSSVCNTHACPPIVEGGWSPWKPWTKCTSSCGGGITFRERDCDDPPPSSNGKYCLGKGNEMSMCNTQRCPQSPGIDASSYAFSVRLSSPWSTTGTYPIPFDHNITYCPYYNTTENVYTAAVYGKYFFSFHGGNTNDTVDAVDLFLIILTNVTMLVPKPLATVTDVSGDDKGWYTATHTWQAGTGFKTAAGSVIVKMKQRERAVLYLRNGRLGGAYEPWGAFFSGMLVKLY